MLEKNVDFAVYTKTNPDANGFFGTYGGAFIPPQLVEEFKTITSAYQTICQSSKFISELRRIRKEYQGRPTPTYHCERLSNSLGNCQIYFKREDLNHTGAHKLKHCMGEGLLAKYMGKKKIIAETGAGQHGVALATAAACSSVVRTRSSSRAVRVSSTWRSSPTAVRPRYPEPAQLAQPTAAL